MIRRENNNNDNNNTNGENQSDSTGNKINDEIKIKTRKKTKNNKALIKANFIWLNIWGSILENLYTHSSKKLKKDVFLTSHKVRIDMKSIKSELPAEEVIQYQKFSYNYHQFNRIFQIYPFSPYSWFPVWVLC